MKAKRRRGLNPRLRSLKPGDRVLMCPELIKENWCNVLKSARAPESRIFVQPAGRFIRDDGTEGAAVLVVATKLNQRAQLWETIWNGERFELADIKKAGPN